MMPPVSLEWPPQTPAWAPAASNGSAMTATNSDLQRIEDPPETGALIARRRGVRSPNSPARPATSIGLHGPAGSAIRPSMHTFRSVGRAAGLAATLLGLGSGAARAHAIVVSSQPAANAVVREKTVAVV